jgi:uncharacterized membrane protein YkvI
VLLAGAAVALACGVFVLTFKSEPSAVGRLGAVLVALAGAAMVTGVIGAIAAFSMRGQTRWATPLAWLASVLMILTCVSSWAGLIAAIGLASGRASRKT